MPTPLWITLAAVCLGIGLLWLSLRRQSVTLGLQVIGGAAAGFIGAQFFMLPIEYCTFAPETSMIDQRFGAFMILIGVIAAVLVVRWGLLQWTAARSTIMLDTQPGAFKGFWLPWLFLLPTLIILLVFLYYPALDTFRLSTLLTRLGIEKTAFVCVDNFTRLLATEAPQFPPRYLFLDWIFEVEYARVMFQTLILALAVVVGGMSLALGIALAAFLPLRGANIYRTLLVWPYAVSPVVAGIIFLRMFNPLGGIVNYGLENLFGFQVGWLNDPNAAPWLIVFASIWKSLGFNILFFIAGLQNIPKDLIEAAAIDGANLFQRFWRIVLPLLSPISFFLLITNMTYAFFETFGTIDYLTQGGPLGSTTTLMYNVFNVGVQNGNLGRAAAQSLILFAIVIGLTFMQFRTSGENVNYGA